MANVSLKLTWANGGVEIDCEASQFDIVVTAAERLLSKASGLGPALRQPVPGTTETDLQDPPADEKKQAKPRPRKSSSRASNGGGEKTKLGTAKYEDYVDFKWDLTDEAELQIVQFYKEKAPKTQNERVAVILHALKTFGARERATYDEIYKAYRMSDRSDPIKNLAGVVSNMQAVNWVSREEDGIRLKVFGEELVEKELPRGEKSKSA